MATKFANMANPERLPVQMPAHIHDGRHCAAAVCQAPRQAILQAVPIKADQAAEEELEALALEGLNSGESDTVDRTKRGDCT